MAEKNSIHSSSNEVKSLVLLATSGEEEAFAELGRRFQDLALGYSYSIVRDFNDYCYREIGEFLEVPESTVNNRMHTGRRN